MNKIKDFCSKKWVLSIGVMAVSFFIMLFFHQDPMFISDELEIFSKGQAIAGGMKLYTDIGSQHMPLMYYIAALFSAVGLNTVVLFRFAFYALTAFLFGLMFFCYSDKFGKKAMLVFPLGMLALMPSILWGTTILSDLYQGIGISILVLELISFKTSEKLSLKSMLMISLAIFISFGSAFVAIFSVFAVGVTVAALEIVAAVKAKENVFAFILRMVKRYWLLVLIVAIPFAVMFGYIALQGSLGDFIGWAYTLNRTIYPKYLGYGSSIFGSLFGGIKYLVAPFIELSFTYACFKNIAWLVLSVLGIAAIYRKKKDKVLLIGLLFVFITTATRAGFESFHGLPVISVGALLAAFFFADKFDDLKDFFKTRSYVKVTAVVLCFVMLLSPLLHRMAEASNKGLSKYAPGEISATSVAIDKLTENGEKVGFSSLNYEYLINGKAVIASSNGGSVPWLWEYVGKDVMEQFNENPPRVYVYDKNLAAWGYKITDYAPELKSFIDENYVSLESYGYPSLYVHNSYSKEAFEILNITEIGNENGGL